jgi:hypothetical protein
VYLATVGALRRRELPTFEVSSRVKLTKPPAEYLATRDSRRELAYEAVLAAGRTTWSAGERVRVYRTRTGGGGLVADLEDDEAAPVTADRRDYDADHYIRQLRDTFAARLARAFTPEDFAAVFADPDQLELFARPLSSIRPVLSEVQS